LNVAANRIQSLTMTTIPVMRPKLPSAERLAPFLKTIDSSRIYSNFGPLALALEDRLARHFGLVGENVTTVANATLGLTLALAAAGARPGTLCLLPAWTFVATAHAARLAGLTPYFVDVDRTTWTLNPEHVADLMSQAPSTVGAIIPVVPFGQPVDTNAWDRFRTRTGMPVVIDAAAAFDALIAGDTPAVVSLHATKVLGAGEGSFVISKDAALIREIRTRANFGFYGTREALLPAINAKLSEYHAAVALAALDEWNEARREWLAVAQCYRAVLANSNRVRFQEGFGQKWVASTCNVSVTDSNAPRVEVALAEAGIETRRWWGRGAQAHPATMEFPRLPVPVTEVLAGSTLGLPLYRDLEPAQIQKIVEIVLESSRG
jgi:dTDP-4-amino-4,6-dideoxygalactose transaminase